MHLPCPAELFCAGSMPSQHGAVLMELHLLSSLSKGARQTLVLASEPRSSEACPVGLKRDQALW